MMRGNWGFPGGGPFEHHMSGVGIAGMVLMIILWIAVIAAIVIGIRALVVHSRRNNAASPTSASAPAGAYPVGPAAGPVTAAPSLLAILEERYARGEIGREAFLQQKQDLGLIAPGAAPTAGSAPSSTTPEATS